VTLLSEIVYWYRPTEERDERTGNIIGYHRKFKADKLQRSYDSFAEEFGFTKNQVRAAIKNLEDIGVIDLEFRTIAPNGQAMNNVLFIGLNVDVLKRLTYPSEIINTPLSNPNCIGVQLGLGTNTEITTETTSEKPQAQTEKPQNPPITPEPATPSGEELLTTYFGEKAPTQEPRKAVDLRNPQDRADYADRLHEQRRAKATNEPWLALYDWVPAPRNGVSRDTLRHVAHVFVSAGVPEPMSDSARKEWKSALSNVYIEAGNERTWEIIQAAAAEVAANIQYNPPHRWVQAIINIKAQKQRVSADNNEGRRGRLVSVAQ